MAKLLVEKGALVDRLDNSGRSVVLSVMKKIKNQQRYETVKYLIEAGADASDKTMHIAALSIAIKNKETDFIKFFTESGADIKSLHFPSVRALLDYEDLTVFKYLAKKGLNLEARSQNDYGITVFLALPFYVTSTSPYHIDRYRLLIEIGANVNAQDSLGRTALMGVVQRGSILELQLIVESGADVHAKDNEGKTALMYITEGPQAKIKAEYLMNNGADMYIKDGNGRSIAMVYLENNSYDLARFFIVKGDNIKGKYYLETPRKCKCATCSTLKGERELESYMGYFLKEGIIVALEKSNITGYSVCVCESENLNEANIIKPVKDGMYIKFINNYCAGGDLDAQYY